MSIQSSTDLGLVKIAAVSPKLHLANVPANVREIANAMRQAADAGAALVAFPELALTGASCGNLLAQQILLKETERGLNHLAALTTELDIAAVVGAPIAVRGQVLNCGVVLGGGQILGIVPKDTNVPATELIWNREAAVPVGANLIFEADRFSDFRFGVVFGEDFSKVASQGSALAQNGASVLVNLSASTEIVGATRSRRALIAAESARCRAAYICASAGLGESTTDFVYAGASCIAEAGNVLAESERYSLKGSLIFAQIDVQKILRERAEKSEFLKMPDCVVEFPLAATHTEIPAQIFGKISPSPFVPEEADARREHCREAFEIQVSGLVRRLAHTQAKNVVLGISGGLDSTLAILVVKEAFARLGLDAAGIHGYSLPGLGTSARTRKNALDLMTRLGIEAKEISIVPAIEQHLRDIEHPLDCFDAAYENAQARERTQILMDLANRCGGFVVGTGDLSEAALGWCTFNGDQMSMYHVNIGVPKTLIRHIIAWVAEEKRDPAIAETLADIIDTPISPELKPTDENGEIAQKTEDLVGPYELHDFFIYHFCGNAFAPKKILLLAENAFAGIYDAATIRKWLGVFLRRFFSQQFKRSACPDGPKVLSVGLSPRGDWCMPSDAKAAVWLEDLESAC